MVVCAWVGGCHSALALWGWQVYDDGFEFYGRRSQCLRMRYAATSGPGLPAIHLQTELERIADFAALPSARKACARLELMQSPAASGRAYERKAHEFELISEKANIGCGFIPDAILSDCLGKSAASAVAIQVCPPTHEALQAPA